MNKINFSTSLGAIFTWYDFIIFNIAIALIFPKLFFTDMGYLIPMLVFAVGFLARPLGGIIFGIIGDRYGRKITLVSTLYVTGISTVFIGLLPTYTDIGVAATILLVAARILQTAAVGGEWGAASTMLVEHNLHHTRQSFFASFVNSGFAIGSVLASLVFMIVLSFGDSFFVDFGWRIPFLLSGILLLIGVYIRKKVLETPEFESIKQKKQVLRNPIKILFANHGKIVLLAGLAISLAPSWIYGIMVFATSYMIQFELISRPDLSILQFFAWCMISISMVVAAWFGTTVKKFNLFITGSVASVLLTFPMFLLVANGEALYAMLLLIPLVATTMSIAPSLFCNLYPTEIRQTGAGVSYNLGLIISGFMAIVSQQILLNTNNLMFVAVAFMILTVLSLAAALYLKKYVK